MTLITDTAQARLVVSRVNMAFKNREGLLSETGDLVENKIPDGVKPLSRDHALFLFYTAVNDHGMKSSRLYANAKMLFYDRRDLFETNKVVTGFIGPQDPRLMDEIGKRLGTRYPKETARTWYVNSERLAQRYGGDPRNLFRSSSDARELLKEIKAFRGYGPKIGGMLLRAVVGLGFADVSGIEEVLVPVDIHDSRVSFQQEYYNYVPKVQQVLLDACNSIGIKWLDVDRALWLIGSSGCVNKRCRLCPLHDVCSIGREFVFNDPQLSLL